VGLHGRWSRRDDLTSDLPLSAPPKTCYDCAAGRGLHSPVAPALDRPAVTGALFGALLIGTFFIYLPGLQGPLLLDDGINIPRTVVSSLDWGEIRNHIFWDASLNGFSRSLTNLSFALSQLFSGLGPYAIKYQNTLLHLLNGALVFWLSFLVLSVGAADRRRTDMLALAITAIWLLHPLQVSTVLYAVQRLVLLSSLFVLLALLVYVKGRIWGFRRPFAAFLVTGGGVVLFGILGILSKESAALLPLYLLAVELFFFRFRAGSPVQKLLLQVLLGLLIALPVLIGLFYLGTHLGSFLATYANRPFTLEERLLSEVHALALYVKLFFVPIPSGMSLFHDDFPIQRDLDPTTAGLAIAYVGLIGAALLLRSNFPGIGFAILWFFIAHALESTIMALELVFEHRNYLAILGLSFVLVLAAARLLATPGLRRTAPALMLALVSLLAFNTAARAFVWGNGELLLRTEYGQHPDSPRILSSLYSLELRRGNKEEARRYLHEARRLEPDSPLHMVQELHTYCTDGGYPPGMALETRELIARTPRTSGLFWALDALTADYLSGRCDGLGYHIVLDLVSAYSRNPDLPTSRVRLLALILHGRLLVDARRWATAEEVYSNALDLAERDPGAYHNLIVNELARPFLESGNIDGLARLLARVAAPAAESPQ